MKRFLVALAILLGILGGSQAWAVTPTYHDSSDFNLPGYSPAALENMGFKTYKLRASYNLHIDYLTPPYARPFLARAGDIIAYKDIPNGSAAATISADGKWRYVDVFYVAYMPCENRARDRIWISRDFEVRIHTVTKIVEVPAKCPTCPAPPPCQPPPPPPPCQTCVAPPVTGVELQDQPIQPAPAPCIRVLFTGQVNQAQVHREYRPGIAQDVAALTYAIKYRPTRIINVNSQGQVATASQTQGQSQNQTQQQKQAQNQKQGQKGGNVTTGPVTVTTTNTNTNIATNPTSVVVGDNNTSDMQTDTTATNGTDPPVTDSQSTPPAGQ